MAASTDPQEVQKGLSVAEAETAAPTVAPASAVAESAPSSATNGDDAASSSVPKPASTPWSDVKVFRPPNTAGPSRLPPPQADDEAKPTAAELKEAFSSHISQRHGPDAPLMTQAMRQREEARLGIKKKEYHEIRIRIRLSDRTTLEGTFPSTAQVPTLYRFLRAHLSQRHARHAFTLYQSPPKRELPESTKDVKLQGKTLRELGMAPAAVVLVRWSDAAMNSNTYPAPLSDETLVLAQDLPTPPSFDTQSAGQTLQDPSSSAAKDKEESASSGTKKAMPKWLKGLQKK